MPAVCVDSYPEDDNLAQLLGLPADDISLLQRENIFYAAQSVLLYLVAYTTMFLYGYIVHAYVAVAAYILSPLVNRFLSLAFKSGWGRVKQCNAILITVILYVCIFYFVLIQLLGC